MRHDIEVKELCKLVRVAGDRVLWWYGNKSYVQHAKSDSSPVTSADIEAHDLLLAELQRYTPGVAVFSEEDLGGDVAQMQQRWQEVRELSEYWLVDPLDGTKGFVGGSGEFTINVALIVNGRPKIGVMMVPVTGECYVAVGNRSFKQNSPKADSFIINTRQCRHQSPVVLVSSHHGKGEEAVLRAKIPRAVMLPMASAVKYLHIADGRADVSFRYSETAAWDIASADAILHGAGGGICDWHGAPLLYNGSSFANPGLVAYGDATVPWWQKLPKS